MKWNLIDTQKDLDNLADLDWEDTESIEYFASNQNYDFFPSDINRSGYREKNLFLLADVCKPEFSYIQFAFIHCEKFDSYFLEEPSFYGKVDNLKRIKIFAHDKTTRLSCARLLYRFVEDDKLKEACEFYKGFLVD